MFKKIYTVVGRGQICDLKYLIMNYANYSGYIVLHVPQLFQSRGLLLWSLLVIYVILLPLSRPSALNYTLYRDICMLFSLLITHSW